MTLWTPDGEKPIRPSDPSEGLAGDIPEELTPEQEAQAREMAKEMAEARQQILEAEVSTVIANHALGIYELAALHLTVDDPDLREARLAIDALAALVESDHLTGKLGDVEPTLREALQNARLMFVQRAQQAKAAAAQTSTADPAATSAATTGTATEDRGEDSGADPSEDTATENAATEDAATDE